MNKTAKKKWLKALRSGEYDQHRESLVNPAGTAFCCLGVLCDLYARETKGRAGFVRHKANGAMIFDDGEGCTDGAVLPSAVFNWAGLRSGDPSTPITMNDHGQSFLQIADWIEENL